MGLKEALHKSLRSDKRTHTDPLLLHSVCDLVEKKRQKKSLYGEKQIIQTEKYIC
jgi:hypothetical protein